MTRLYLAGAAILATLALTAATASLAQSSNQPIPGIDVVIQKQPWGSGAMVIGTVGTNGAFGGSVKLPAGTYLVTTACSPRVRCPAHRLTTLMVNGRTVSTAARGGVRVAVGDLNGDGKEELTTFRGTITLIR